jgi:hypothetical protein
MRVGIPIRQDCPRTNCALRLWACTLTGLLFTLCSCTRKATEAPRDTVVVSKPAEPLASTERLNVLANRIGAGGSQTPLNRSTMVWRRISLPPADTRSFVVEASVFNFTLTPLSGPTKAEQKRTGATFTTRDGRVMSSHGAERREDTRFPWPPSEPVAVGDTWQARCGWSMSEVDLATYELVDIQERTGGETLLITYDWQAVKPQVGWGRSLMQHDQSLGITTRSVGWWVIGGYPGPPAVDTTLSLHIEDIEEIQDPDAVEKALLLVADAEAAADVTELRRQAVALRAEHSSGPLHLVAEIAEILASNVEARRRTP